MLLIFIVWMLGALGIQILLNWISRKINYSYSKKMEMLAIGLNLFVWGMVYSKYLFPSVEAGEVNYTVIILFSLVASVLISIIFIDLQYYEIPNSYNAFIALVGVVYIFQVPHAWQNYLFGGIIAFVLFFIIAIFTGGNLGMGDVKMAGGLGLLLGKALMPNFFLITFASGTLIGLFLLAFKFKTKKDRIAFGPYISFAFIWLLIS